MPGLPIFTDNHVRGPLIRVRRTTGADRAETAARLLAWMDNDPYGFASDLDSEAAKVLDKAGLAAFVRQVEGRFKAAATAKPTPGEPFRRNPENQRRVWGAALRTLYLAQRARAACQKERSRAMASAIVPARSEVAAASSA